MICPNCGFEFGLLSFGGWTFDERERKLREAPSIQWTAGEARLIMALLQAQGEFVGRLALWEDCAQHKERHPNIKLVDVLVCHIRTKLNGLPLIETKYGHGHRIKPKEKL